MVFTPEFSNSKLGVAVLVSNHNLVPAEALHHSIAFQRARILFARENLPLEFHTVRVIYDIRGQDLTSVTVDLLKQGLEDLVKVEFLQ